MAGFRDLRGGATQAKASPKLARDAAPPNGRQGTAIGGDGCPRDRARTERGKPAAMPAARAFRPDEGG